MLKADKVANKWLEQAARKYKLDVLYSDDTPYQLEGTFKKAGVEFTVRISDDSFSIDTEELMSDMGDEAKFNLCDNVCLDPWSEYEIEDMPHGDIILGCLYQSLKDGGCTGGTACNGGCERCRLSRNFRNFVFGPAHHKIYFPVST